MNHGGGVVFGVGALAGRISQHRGAQGVVGVGVGTAHAFVDHFLHAHAALPLHIHAHFEKHGGNAGVLADGAVAFGTHAAVDQNLRHGVFSGGVFFFFPSLGERLDVVYRMVIADKLESIGNALNEIFLLDDSHGRFLGGGRCLGGLLSKFVALI